MYIYIYIHILISGIFLTFTVARSCRGQTFSNVSKKLICVYIYIYIYIYVQKVTFI